MKTIWSFAIGRASIGEAVRDLADHSFPHKASLLIPYDFAETKSAAARRRIGRVRAAHRAREKWLDQVMRQAGIEPLAGRKVIRDRNGHWQTTPGDQRLEREFPARGDSTCYTSCLLRIKLLCKEVLEPWQIYKALHSAIQQRGYDPKVPWMTKKSRLRKIGGEDDEEKGLRERMEQFAQTLERMSRGKPEFHFPCYYKAWKMGLWNPAEPETLKIRIDCAAETTRKQVVPRPLVEKEIRCLAEAAALQFPVLENQADYLLYGPAGKPYASRYPALRKEHHLREGSRDDWQGVLGQKVPRFDNRIIGKCVLIPRLNACKIRADEKGCPLPQSRLAIEVGFLLKLKNMRVQRSGSGDFSLTAGELRTIFKEGKFERFKITQTQWRKVCEKLGVFPLLGHEEVEEPRVSGRSRFCRPALGILKRLILSGQNPADFHRSELDRLKGNRDPKRGLVPNDLKFLTHMGVTWAGMSIPNEKLDSLVRSATDRNAALHELIGSQKDPIVRHRLGVFSERLAKLQSRFGVPEEIVLEFARADFMGKKARLEYRKFLKKRRQGALAGSYKQPVSVKTKWLGAQTGEGLTYPDAIYLDDYYHTLADTDWVAKLCRAVVALHFGWHGIDDLKRPRITVVPGELTDCVRRGFNLNGLLNLHAQCEEAVTKKNPDDRRHHALEAMVMNFLAGWTGDAAQEPSFPMSVHVNAHEFFAKEIATVMPEQLAYEKAMLAETIYGGRDGKTKIVQRVPLRDLAFKPIGINKTKFDREYFSKQMASIRDPKIAKALAGLLKTGVDEQQWEEFCASFHLKRRDGSDGPLVRRVLVEAGDSTAYKEMSKSPGAFRRGKKSHKAQIVYLKSVTGKKGGTKETVQVRPVYAFESYDQVEQELREKYGDGFRIYGIFRAGCQITVARKVHHRTKPLPPGKYQLNSIRTRTKDVKVTTQSGVTHPEIPIYRLGNMIKAGLRRIR